MKVKLFVLFLLPCCFFLSSFHFKKEKAGNLNINFNLKFDNDSLKLNSQSYITANGDTVYIDVFRFYISNIQLMIKEKILFSENESHHLIDAEKKESTAISINNISINEYDFISFDIGIDSATSNAGAMGGDLDPVKGMYWEWNSGYINAKLEGHSSSCKTVHHTFEFHIGGYRSPNYVIRKIVLPVKNFQIKEGADASVNIKVNVAEWFKNPTTIDVSKTNSIMMPGKDAMMVANNYADMFSVE